MFVKFKTGSKTLRNNQTRSMKQLIEHLKNIEHGFKHIETAGDIILSEKTKNHFDLAMTFLNDDSYQVRMLATYILGRLSTGNIRALQVLETKVAEDDNWRVQEMLAKAFDHYCSTIGYEECLPAIQRWLSDVNPNVKRAVVEGLRIWTSRPYFNQHPQEAIHYISQLKTDESEYLRKSIGNALRDISKKHQHLVDEEVAGWDLTDKRISFIKKLINKQ